MMNHADFVPRYKRLREVRFGLQNMLAGSLSKAALDEAGRALGLMQRGVLVFDAMEHMSVLMDYGIYNVYRDGRNAVQRYLDKSPPPPGSEKRVVLESMLKAYYSIIQIVDTEPGVGVAVRDVLRGDTGFLVDIGFSMTARKGYLMATRIVPAPEGDYLTTGGAALPVSAAVLTRIEKEIAKTFGPEFDFTRITPQQEATLAALVIRRCLAAPEATQIAYAEPGQPLERYVLEGAAGGMLPSPSFSSAPSDTADAPPVRVRANRNDPCPCGSGRKYKSCCGKR